MVIDHHHFSSCTRITWLLIIIISRPVRVLSNVINEILEMYSVLILPLGASMRAQPMSFNGGWVDGSSHITCDTLCGSSECRASI